MTDRTMFDFTQSVARFENVEIRNISSPNNVTYDPLIMRVTLNSEIGFKNSTIHKIEGDLLVARTSRVSLENTTLTNITGKSPVLAINDSPGISIRNGTFS